ncbi:MAG: FHA domain-containing protein [Colwellia sp.]
MELIIEEISRNQKLLHRHKLNKPIIHVGRDYHNDIIISDPHICPSHISINLVNGDWLLTDNYSVNGTFIETDKGKEQADNQHIIRDGDIISLGKSQLRLLFTDHHVAPTQAFNPFDSFIDLMRHPVTLSLSISLFSILAGMIFYLNSPIDLNFSQLFVPAISMTFGFALWPASVALVSHLQKHDPRIMAQLGISFVLFNLMWLSNILESIVAFNSVSHSIYPLLVMLLSVVLAFCLFWLNGYIGFHMTARRRIVMAVSITTLLFGGDYLVNYSKKPEFNPRPQYNATLMMPTLLVASSVSVDKFIDDASKLFDKTAKEAVKQ